VCGRGFGRLLGSRYALILDFMETVKEIPFGPGPDDKTESGKHSRHCQSSSVFEDIRQKRGVLPWGCCGSGGCRISGFE